MRQLCLRAMLVASILLFLNACSGTYRSYYQSLRYAFTPQPDVSLTLAQVNAAAADLLYVRNGERPQAVMALAFIEQDSQKWLAADNALLVLAAGRVIATRGFSKDLLYATATTADPLTLPLTAMGNQHWQRALDWRTDEYGYEVSSVFFAPVRETQSYFGKDLSLYRVTEQLAYQAPSSFWRNNRQWHNHYWFTEEGVLLKSVQQLAPDTEPLEMVFISRVARIVSEE